MAEQLVIAVLLAIVTLAVYAPARHYDFVALDDPLYVSENPHVAGLTAQNVAWAWTNRHGGYWIPLVWMSYMLDVTAFGPGPGGHHSTNVGFHLLNTLLLFWVLLRMTGAAWRSGLVAALFAVHPLHVESVAWITERKDVVSACFWLLAMAVYTAFVRERRLWRYALLTLCFVAGLLAKPMVVTLPFALVLLDVWPLRRYPTQSLQSLLVEKVPLMAIALVGSAVAYFAQEQAGAVSTLEVYSVGLRISNALVSYVTYLRKTVWPMDLSVFYSHPDSIPAWTGVGAALLLVAISIVAVRAFRRQPAVLVGWLWFLITFVPAIGLVQVGVQSMADRFTYIPLIGIFIAAVWSVPDNLRVSRAVLAGIAVAVVAAYAAVARHQLSYWKDSVTLWTRATELTLNVDSYRAHLSLGDVLSTQGRASEAIGHFTEAARLKPDSVEARHKLGLALASQGRIDEAATAFVEAIRLAPQSAAAHADLGLAFLKQGKNDQAIEQYTEAVRLDPNLAETQNSLGALLAQNGRMRDSIPHFSEAVRLNPDFEVAHLNLAIAFVNVDQLDDAEREFKEVHRLNPGNAIAARALGDLARRARRF
jgi:tetratricopeptide (TPR) repeat protein